LIATYGLLNGSSQASNGASDYGNKFGEPIITGFSRSFGMRLPSGERREWVKPIMFTSGLGTIDSTHVDKEAAEKGFLIVKVRRLKLGAVIFWGWMIFYRYYIYVLFVLCRGT